MVKELKKGWESKLCRRHNDKLNKGDETTRWLEETLGKERGVDGSEEMGETIKKV